MVQVGIVLPHELFSTMFHFSNHELFFSLFTGTPSDARRKCLECFDLRLKDLQQYWDRNFNLAHEIWLGEVS